jgi:Subtilase family
MAWLQVGVWDQSRLQQPGSRGRVECSGGGNCVNTTGACLFSIDTTINNGTTTPGTNGYTDQLTPNLGTSFSAPMVSAIAALMTSVNSNLRAPQLIARLKEGAKAFPVSSDPTVPNCHVPAGPNLHLFTLSAAAGESGNAHALLTAAANHSLEFQRGRSFDSSRCTPSCPIVHCRNSDGRSRKRAMLPSCSPLSSLRAN